MQTWTIMYPDSGGRLTDSRRQHGAYKSSTCPRIPLHTPIAMSHPVAEFTSPSSWSFVEDKLSPFAKETLAKVVDFVQTECLP
ncbi:hypothetical protein FS749_015127, partial [Ceratobasidium sp. UAMH 11750]